MKMLFLLLAVLLLPACANTLEAFRADVDAQVAKYCDDPITMKGQELCEAAKEKLQEVRDKVDEELQEEKAPE